MKPLEEKLAEAEEALAELSRRGSEGALIVVEGARDEEALRRLGVEGRFYRLKANGRRLADALCELSAWPWDLIILTDFDRRGRELAFKAAEYLERHSGRAPDLSFWRKLSSLIQNGVKDIEGLAAFLERRQPKARPK